jgi:hypothetical protein
MSCTCLTKRPLNFLSKDTIQRSKEYGFAELMLLMEPFKSKSFGSPFFRIDLLFLLSVGCMTYKSAFWTAINVKKIILQSYESINVRTM